MMKKGVVLLRNIIFMTLLFGAVMAMGTIFVNDMATEYSNTDMETQFNSDEASGLGSSVSGRINTSIAGMREASEPQEEGKSGLIGAFNTLGGVLTGASTIISAVFRAPIIAGDAIEILMNSMAVPTVLSAIISNFIILVLYAIIIFGVITAALRGGKV